jgi:hypothetical protein
MAIPPGNPDQFPHFLIKLASTNKGYRQLTLIAFACHSLRILSPDERIHLSPLDAK